MFAHDPWLRLPGWFGFGWGARCVFGPGKGLRQLQLGALGPSIIQVAPVSTHTGSGRSFAAEYQGAKRGVVICQSSLSLVATGEWCVEAARQDGNRTDLTHAD
jgi:hypothetical protein